MSDSDLQRRVYQLFVKARAIESPRERWVFLAEATQGDSALYREVDRRLNAEENASTLSLFVLPDDWVPDTSEPEDETQETMPEEIGEFPIHRRIGRSKLSIVYEALQTDFDRSLAIKVFTDAAMRQPNGVVDRAIREGKLLARFSKHPDFAYVHSQGKTPTKQQYFVLELIGGAAGLIDYADQHGLGEHERLDLFLRACVAVEKLHTSGVIHRDLKPANILIDEEGRLKLIDLGIAWDSNTDRVGEDEFYARHPGTRQYAAPERNAAYWGRTGPTSEPTETIDIFSLGMILFELISGSRPRWSEARGAKPSSDLPDIGLEPQRLGDVNAKYRGTDLEQVAYIAMQPRADQRYPSVAELREEVERCRDGFRTLAKRKTQGRVERVSDTISQWARTAGREISSPIEAIRSLPGSRSGSINSDRQRARRRTLRVRWAIAICLVAIAAGSVVGVRTWQLARRASLTLTGTDGATVSIEPVANPEAAFRFTFPITDPILLPPGTYRVSSSRDGLFPREITIKLGPRDDREFDLTATPMVVRSWDVGQPLYLNTHWLHRNGRPERLIATSEDKITSWSVTDQSPRWSVGIDYSGSNQSRSRPVVIDDLDGDALEDVAWLSHAQETRSYKLLIVSGAWGNPIHEIDLPQMPSPEIQAFDSSGTIVSVCGPEQLYVLDLSKVNDGWTTFDTQDAVLRGGALWLNGDDDPQLLIACSSGVRSWTRLDGVRQVAAFPERMKDWTYVTWAVPDATSGHVCLYLKNNEASSVAFRDRPHDRVDAWIASIDIAPPRLRWWHAITDPSSPFVLSESSGRLYLPHPDRIDGYELERGTVAETLPVVGSTERPPNVAWAPHAGLVLFDPARSGHEHLTTSANDGVIVQHLRGRLTAHHPSIDLNDDGVSEILVWNNDKLELVTTNPGFSPRWTAALNTPTSPMAGKRRVVGFGTGSPMLLVYGSDRGAVVLGQEDGEALWRTANQYLGLGRDTNGDRIQEVFTIERDPSVLTCRDGRTGEVIWKHLCASETVQLIGVVNTTTNPMIALREGPLLYYLDQATGRLTWAVEDECLRDPFTSVWVQGDSPDLDGDTLPDSIFTGFSRQRFQVTAIGTTSGKERWSFTGDKPFRFDPGHGDDQEVTARFMRDADGPVVVTVVVHPAFPHRVQINAFRAATGESIWTHEMTGEMTGYVGGNRRIARWWSNPPLVAATVGNPGEPQLIIVSGYRELVAFDMWGGVAWRVPVTHLGPRMTASDSAVDGLVIQQSEGDHLSAVIDLMTGKMITGWSLQFSLSDRVGVGLDPRGQPEIAVASGDGLRVANGQRIRHNLMATSMTGQLYYIRTARGGGWAIAGNSLIAWYDGFD